ncbi:hypothetical protein Vadar_022781 [Vaccinium darrowii]|uniref:Uncharacterized protein n=1 Tax=Vaccinium darrowii TaxID=229202 RepID=A0ACB7XC16_9ERIC|nr:hypothetical protein Vadar_022781 [Vaccinium darrowii]
MADPLERLGSDVAAWPEESTMKEELCMEIDPLFRESLTTTDDWRKALNKVVPRRGGAPDHRLSRFRYRSCRCQLRNGVCC